MYDKVWTSDMLPPTHHAHRWMKDFKPYQGSPDQWFGPNTYSCAGEDLMIANLFHLMGIERPSYLDIGAHHPFIISNTALLYSRGSRGVNVEANPNLIPAFLHHRPEDVNVNMGVALAKGTQKFYMWDDGSGRNTFSEEASKKMAVLTKTIDLPVTTLNAIVDQYCNGAFPDLLTVDIEGLDFAVLSSAVFYDWSKPKIICVEAWLGDDQTSKFVEMMKPNGYSLVCRIAMDLIFIQTELMEKCEQR